MSKILLINGSPTEQSRSGALLNYAAPILNIAGIETKLITLRDFPAEDLIFARYNSASFTEWQRDVLEADALIISTPLYKASFTGGLKALLDVLPQSAFRGKSVLPIATGGSPGHLLAIDFAIKPVLATLGASDIHQGVYVIDSQFQFKPDGSFELEGDLQERLDDAIRHLAEQIQAFPLTHR